MTWRSGRGFRVGAMRERILVESLSVATSDAGDKTQTWSTLHSSEPASYEEVSGGETLRGKQVESGVTAIFTVHYRTTYNTTQRITHDGTTYGIVRVNRVEGGRRYLELHCKS